MERALTVYAVLALMLSLVLAQRASAEADARVFALVIANNRSTRATQPDLQYADDDGARYYKLFQSIARDGDLTLLTSFDKTSREQYLELARVARPATVPELLAARDRLAAAVREARSRGERTVLYLVFAGHGEVRDGRGMLDLEDRQVDGAFLEHELLAEVPADTKHLLLDSCNSFFVMNPRKPGGRRWATPKDMAFGFSARHPEVGLFLSTNSESEVFEWSELESGVFSHEVRSGLRGGADVNGDGTVSYLELAGFVERANRGMVHEPLRPQLFFRGPHGDQNAPLFPPSRARGRRVVADQSEARLWIRSEAGERLVDVHKEPGALTLVVPEDAGALTVYEEREAAGRMQLSERPAPRGEESVVLSALPARGPALAPRGSRLFGQLFTQAYGPVALAEYVAAQSSEREPVFGVSAAQVARMRSYVAQLAAEGNARRWIQATALLGVAAMTTSISIAQAVSPGFSERRALVGGLSGLSAVLIGAGLYRAVRPTASELVLESFDRELHISPRDAARTMAKTERSLQLLARQERRARELSFWLLQTGAAGYVAAGALALAEDDAEASRSQRAFSAAVYFSGAALLSALGLAVRYVRSPTERLLNLYREDPTTNLQFGGTLSRSRLSFGLHGAF